MAEATLGLYGNLDPALDILSAAIGSIVFYLAYRLVRRLSFPLQRRAFYLRRSAEVDDLTALPNRSFFRRAATRRMSLSRENYVPLAWCWI